MTYNQIISRIIGIATAHRQIRNCYKGLVTDFLTDRKTLFPSAFLQDNGNGNISVAGRDTAYPFRLFILDLVNVSEDTKVNEQDVMSDCMLIAVDMIAQISSYNYTDWRISAENPTQFVVEDENDFIAGVMVDFTIKVIFNKDKCQIPSTNIPIEPNYIKMYDTEYIATGDEGTIISIPILANKKVLFISRESLVIYKVSNNPNTTEYTWDGTNITLGLGTNQGERYLILYRNY